MNTEEPKIIVAEVSKNWTQSTPEDRDLLSSRFELVINVNLARGYELKDWKVSAVIQHDGAVNETIIAIFEKIKP